MLDNAQDFQYTCLQAVAPHHVLAASFVEVSMQPVTLPAGFLVDHQYDWLYVPLWSTVLSWSSTAQRQSWVLMKVVKALCEIVIDCSCNLIGVSACWWGKTAYSVNGLITLLIWVGQRLSHSTDS